MNSPILFLHQNPFFRIVIALIIGIIVGIYFNIIGISFFSFIIAIVLYTLKRFVFNKDEYKFRWMHGMAFVLVFVGIGNLVCILHKEAIQSVPEEQTFIATIIETPTEKPRSVLITVDLQNKAINSYKSVLFLQKDSNALNLSEGDKIITHVRLKETDLSFFNNKGIYATAYVTSTQWYLMKINTKFSLKNKANKASKALLGVFKDFINPNNFGLISALTFGDTSSLNSEIKQDFAKSGSSHVLSVSGLHIGIIYIAFSFIFSFLGKNKIGTIFKHICIILCIWIYAFLCGLPPSVVRSAAMLSLISGAYIFQKKSATYNAVFFSAFLMLLYEPMYLYDIGFQLSYCAVLSILIFHKKIYKLIPLKNKILDNIWSLTSVSIAAQLGTFPISLYYFHQFPTYFLLSNYIAIPCSTLLIYLSICLFFTSFIPIISGFIKTVINYIAEYMQDGISYICNFPYASINIEIELWQVYAIFGLILSTYMMLTKRRFCYVCSNLCIIIIFLTNGIIVDLCKLFTTFAEV
ncbi:MAG: ComEC/Rec2 family competence protein [Paludibacteraceae bacterium]|jgi:competence protein ComEC|nr:ComEC/Rec2 family competence protein [Paludibacteraceae bacterium]HPG55682.1 ComEC/Rec2 family competence protein [Candidatus Enterocola sp.]